MLRSGDERKDQEKRLRLIGFNGRDWLPIWLPGTDYVSHAGPLTIILPGKRVWPKRPFRNE
jgi:hypothetical protein